MINSGPKYLKSDARKVRVPDAFYERLEKMAEEGRKEGVSITGLAQQAFEVYFDLLDQGQLDPNIAPQNSTEREFIFMLLALLREPQDPVEQAALTLLRKVYGNRRPKSK
jgi:hypothetical protein